MRVDIYDLEVLPNAFVYVGIDRDTDEITKLYVLNNNQEQAEEVREMLRHVRGHIGFNNLSYDGQIIEAIIRGHVKLESLNSDCYALSQRLIKVDRNKGEYLPYFSTTIPQLDLFKIWHFDNMAKHTSLKKIEFNMRFDNLEDLPFHYDHVVKDDEIDVLADYCVNDVRATKAFYKKSLDKIDLRKKLSSKYNLSLLNASDAKIGTEIILDLYSKAVNKDKKEIKEMRTWRNKIALEDVVFELFKQ